MENNKRFAKATWQIMEQLLEADSLDTALSESLSIILREIGGEVGIIWLLDKNENRLRPVFYSGIGDISGISVDNGFGIAGTVTDSGKSVVLEKPHDDPRFDNSIFDEQGIHVRSMLCVPLYDLSKTIGCIQIVNKKDRSAFDGEEQQLCERMASLAAITIDERGFTIEPETDREVLISLQNVTKEFTSAGKQVKILKGITLNIYKGEFLVVLGESGCGKSTMMNIIGGMDYLTDGKLLVEGVDYSHPTDQELTEYRRHYIGFIFQSYNLMPNLSALDNVRFISEICDDPLSPEEALSRVGLAAKGNSFPSQLSGGQQQRIAIARALVKRPKLILADEPTAALDYETSIEVLSAMEDAVRKEQTTVVMITHNPEIAKMADRVVKLKSGRAHSIKHNSVPLKATDLEW